MRPIELPRRYDGDAIDLIRVNGGWSSSWRTGDCGGVDRLRLLREIATCTALPRATLSVCTSSRCSSRSGNDDILRSSVAAACYCQWASTSGGGAFVAAVESVNLAVDWTCNWISCRYSADSNPLMRCWWSCAQLPRYSICCPASSTLYDGFETKFSPGMRKEKEAIRKLLNWNG